MCRNCISISCILETLNGRPINSATKSRDALGRDGAGIRPGFRYDHPETCHVPPLPVEHESKPIPQQRCYGGETAQAISACFMLGSGHIDVYSRCLNPEPMIFCLCFASLR